MENYIEKIKDLVIEGEDEDIVDAIKEAISNGTDPSAIVSDGLIEAMNVVGPMMATGELYVPEVLMSAQTMQLGLEYIKPMLKSGDLTNLGRVVIGTVEGDLHDIGKDLVAMLLESSGFEVKNLGIDQPAQVFIDEAENADIIAISALLTTTMPAMRDTVKQLKEKHVKAKIIIGGAPIGEEFASDINADGYAEDAAAAVILCKDLLSA